MHYTNSHIIRFVVFFSMMVFLSFIRIKFWHSMGYFFYFIIILLLIYASLYGITASGSQSDGLIYILLIYNRQN